MNRRHFLSSSLGLAVGSASGLTPLPVPLQLGYDNFAVRAMGWKAKELVDYAVKSSVVLLSVNRWG